MKLTVLTYGTEGDARPLAHLCRALIDAGHDATLLADASTLGAARALAVPCVPLAGDIRGALAPEQAIAGVVGAAGRGVGATARALARIADANAEAWLRTTIEAAGGADAILVGGLAAFVGFSAAEALRLPAIGVGMIPITPTRAFPSPFLPRRIPGWLNRPSQALVNRLLWRAFRARTNRARRRVCGLPPRRRLWTGHPMLYGISPTLCPPPRDWPPEATICGQWTRPSAAWSPPPALRAFLDAGEPPLYVGFGSMTGFDAGAMRRTLVEAIGGRRAVFQPGWSGIGTRDLPSNIHAVGEAPHDWLFPRVSAAIHHGGSGTTHSAARAGVPSIALPFAGDQFFWADRLVRAGLSPARLDGRDVDAARLAAAIDAAGGDGIRQRARAAGARMRAEDGLATAVARIEGLLAPGGPLSAAPPR